MNETNKPITLLLMLKSKQLTVMPKDFVHAVGIYTEKSWYLQHGSQTFVFNSEFAPYSSQDMTMRGDDQEFIHGGNSKDHYITLYRNRIPGSVRSITRLYFCNQVELTSNEVIFSQLQGTIYINMTNRYLSDGQFAIVQSDAYEVRVRICIDDSGMTDDTNSSGVKFNIEMVLLWIVSMIQVHTIYLY